MCFVHTTDTNKSSKPNMLKDFLKVKIFFSPSRLKSTLQPSMSCLLKYWVRSILKDTFYHVEGSYCSFWCHFLHRNKKSWISELYPCSRTTRQNASSKKSQNTCFIYFFISLSRLSVPEQTPFTIFRTIFYMLRWVLRSYMCICLLKKTKQ